MEEHTSSTKQITLFLPSATSVLFQEYNEWTPEETEIILSIGNIALKHAKLGFGPLE
jgi:hypothetical protein